jgi:putative ABC transport system permease protein
MGWPVIRAAAGGLRRRRVQAVVIFLVVLISTAAATLGLALLGNSGGPWQRQFAADHGADVVASIRSDRATTAQLAATRRLPVVTQAVGPFPETTISGVFLRGDFPLPPVAVDGRASPGGRLDDLELISGRWAQRPGEIVVSDDLGILPTMPAGQITITTAPGKPKLTVVGFAESVTDSAGAWVVPAELAALRPRQAPAESQMLYKFRSAGTKAQVQADIGAVAHALPAGAITYTYSWLTQQGIYNTSISLIAPFVVAFAIMGLALSALIVANVVSGAVVAGYRRIGILKSIGFTPAQVTAGYIARIGVPAVPGILIGLVFGNVIAVPALKQSSFAFGVPGPRQHVPLLVNITVPLAMFALVLLAALLPAVRAGRLSASQVMVAGQAPRAGRGYAPYRLFGRLPLPRPVTLGLGAPFARPARAAVAFVVILFGTAAVVYAVGLTSSLDRAAGGSRRAIPGQVQVLLNFGNGPTIPGSPRARQAEAALKAQPGTLRYVEEAHPAVGTPALVDPLYVQAFNGNYSWAKFEMISGHFYRGPGQVVINGAFANLTNLSVGDKVRLTYAGRTLTDRIVGEAFDPQHRAPCVFTSWQTLGGAPGAATGLTIAQYDVELRPGVSAGPYAVALAQRLGPKFIVNTPAGGKFYSAARALLELLTLMTALVAALGVLNTVLLWTRDRVHDLGVFKAVGMTPRQSLVMIVCWVAVPAIIAAPIAIPAGILLHSVTAKAMEDAAFTAVPQYFLNVWGPTELVLLALAGLVIAVAGALLPASWAARSPTAAVLRVE